MTHSLPGAAVATNEAAYPVVFYSIGLGGVRAETQDQAEELASHGYIVVSNWGSPNALYHNNGNSNAWLKVKLRGTVSNCSGIGAKVRVKAIISGAARWQMRQISGGDGVVQNSIFAHFGLGNATNIDVVRVEWPSGIVQELTNVAVRQLLTIQEAPRLIPGNLAGVFQVMGGKGGRYCIEATTNLANWECIAQLTNSQAIDPFTDTNASVVPRRFYRALKQ
jgi:hypothetical protein